MKRDCGGAAAILGAFRLAVLAGFKQNLHAVFCLAENSVGPLATRPDDIHTLYSGRTVEINNTDAEGRLVLADGVVYAQKDLKADIILDMATLTGGQVIPLLFNSFISCLNLLKSILDWAVLTKSLMWKGVFSNVFILCLVWLNKFWFNRFILYSFWLFTIWFYLFSVR